MPTTMPATASSKPPAKGSSKLAPKVPGTRITQVAVVANTAKLKKRLRKQLQAALRETFGETAWLTVEKGRKAKKAAARAVAHGAELVVVAGGDGTVRAAAEALVGTDVPLAVIPAGTANLFAGAMDLPQDPAEIVALAAAGSTRRIDTGTCNGMTFNVMAGSGFDAAMLDTAEAGKERLGTFAYVKAWVQEAKRREPFGLQVRVDGKDVFDGAATGVLVGNLGTLKGGIEALPDASPTDGVLDVAVITASGLRDWATLMLAAARHRQRTAGTAHLWHGRDVRVTFESKHRFELDGGVKGRAKQLDVTVRPSSLVVVAPPA